MLGTSYSVDVLVSHSTHCLTLWVFHTSYSDFIQDSSKSHYKWITALLTLVTMSGKSSSTGTPTAVTTDTDISGSQATRMFPFLPWFVVLPAKFNGGIFPTKIGLSTSKLYIVNSTITWWYVTLVGSDGCSEKYFYWLILHIIVPPRDLLYCDSIVHPPIILYGHLHITNWYFKNSTSHLCTTCGTLASDSKDFFIPLKSVSTVNSVPHK